NKNYWGLSMPFNKGRHNIELLDYEYFRDENSAFEAFKAGLIDLWRETDPKRWQTGYDFPAARDGRIIKKEIKTGIPSGLRGFVFNTRKKPFKDIQVRRALSLVLNFDWINKSLFSGAYQRTESYFQNSNLSAQGQSASPTEMKILRGAKLPREILQNGYVASAGDEKGHNRQVRQTALDLLKKSGYAIVDGRLAHKRSGDALEFEILVQTREDERLALTYSRMLNSIGVMAKVRYVDATQYQNRLQSFDFDMIIYNWYASLSPGNEQAFYWGSAAADQNGSRNYPGIKSKQVDRAIEALTQARKREDFVTAARALDRLLMGGHYVVPLYHLPRQWFAVWSQVEHSWRHALYGAQIDSWWINPQN
ncbi:MAG: extracellular solute-binding protein, partial [Pseudomonadota bacterium]|nr:extracellular solute-binding protein [Pseudomonadota bacterium]